MNTPTPPSSRSQSLRSINDLLLYRLGRLSANAGAMVVRLCEGNYGITRREWGVIGHLHEQGPLTPSALAVRFELDRARTSRMVTSLVTKGLVTRQTVPGNRRQAVLELTPAALALYDELMPQVQDINRRILSTLSADEMARLDNYMERLHSRIGEVRQELDAALPRTQRRLGQRRV